MNPAFWLERAAKISPNNPALMVEDTVTSDYKGFAERAARIETVLRDDYEIRPGDRVAIFMANRIEYLELLYGIWFALASATSTANKLRSISLLEKISAISGSPKIGCVRKFAIILFRCPQCAMNIGTFEL